MVTQSLEKQTGLIRNVSDTAWLVAALRAVESDRKDSLFKDPYALKLVGEKGLKIVSELSGGIDLSWFMAVRTYVIDHMILNIIKQNGIDSVVNLACGLCTRPYRLSGLPPNLNWFEVDLEGVVEYKQSSLAKTRPFCNVNYKIADLSLKEDRASLYTFVKERAKKTLVITEGLLLYLTEENVSGLANELWQQENFILWLTDFYGSDDWDTNGVEWRKYMKESNAPIQFAPKDGTGFFGRHNWNILDSKSFIEEGKKLERNPPKIEPNMVQTSPFIHQDLDDIWDKSEILLLNRK